MDRNEQAQRRALARKKRNTLLFMLLGTLLNLALMVVLFVVCIIVILKLVPAESPLAPISMLAAFIISIGGSFFLYGKIVKTLVRKFDLESKMAPLFGRRQKRRRPDEG